MKKLYSFLMVMIIAAGALTMTSCTEDQIVGMQMEGTWEGDMYMYSYYNGRNYYSSYTELQFTSDPFRVTKGYGYWVDYYSSAPWDYYASHIRWTVENGVITIYSIEDGFTYYISDYRINNGRFEGYIDGGDGESMFFQLRKVADPDWDSYTYGWDNGFWSKDNKFVWEDDGNVAETGVKAQTTPQRGIGKKAE